MRAERIVEEVKKRWKQNKKLPHMILSWPAEMLRDDQGNLIDRLVSLDVPPDIPLKKAIVDMVTRTQPYALLICHISRLELRIVLESHHGARSWFTPVRKHGDARVLGKTKQVDGVGFGVLWRKETNLA